ncbi:sensor histidine kinase [Candidatus Bipolaricaulota bacterium]
MAKRGGSLLGRSKSWLDRAESRVVNWALEQRPNPLRRNPHFWAIAGLSAGFTVLYYGAELGLARCLPSCAGFFNTVHDLHRGLFFIPIIYASFVFRMQGGAVMSLYFLLVMMPRAIAFSPYPHPMARAIVFFVPAILLSLLITSLLERVKRARAARAQLADLHDELAESLIRLQESEEQLIQAEKLSSLGQMAASIAHEINNPLAGVLVYTQLIAKKLAQGTMQTDVALEYLAKMAREVDRSSRVIRNLLDFARPSELSLGDVDVNAVIEDALALVRHRAVLGQIEIVEDLCPDLPQVYADYDQLRQVLVNLTLNAIQATPIEGRVTLRTRVADGNLLQIIVEDTGHGISEANCGKLFTPFFTTKEKGEGVGLGLAVAKGIIEKHAGLIDVRSAEGEGTTFVVSLPFQARREPPG